MFLHIVQLKVSLYWFPSSGSFSDDGKRDTDLLVQQKSSEIIVVLYCLTRTIGFPVGPLPTKAQVLGHSDSVRHRSHLMDWALSPIMDWLVTPTTFMQQCIMQADHHCRQQGL